MEDWLAPEEHFADLRGAALYQKRIEANLKLIQYRKATGELIETELVRHLAGEVSRAQKEALYGFIDTAAPELAAITDPKLVRVYLREKMPLLFDSLEDLWIPASKTA